MTATKADLLEEVDTLRELLRDVVDVVEGCHDCISYSGDEELFARLRAAGAWDTAPSGG